MICTYVASATSAGSHIASVLTPHQYLHGGLLLYIPRLSSCLIHLRLVGNGAMHYNNINWLGRTKRPLRQVIECFNTTGPHVSSFPAKMTLEKRGARGKARSTYCYIRNGPYSLIYINHDPDDFSQLTRCDFEYPQT